MCARFISATRLRTIERIVWDFFLSRPSLGATSLSLCVYQIYSIYILFYFFTYLNPLGTPELRETPKMLYHLALRETTEMLYHSALPETG